MSTIGAMQAETEGRTESVVEGRTDVTHDLEEGASHAGRIEPAHQDRQRCRLLG